MNNAARYAKGRAFEQVNSEIIFGKAALAGLFRNRSDVKSGLAAPHHAAS